MHLHMQRNGMNRGRGNRRGGTLVLMALAIVGIMAFAAFALDVGYILMARSQLQNSADAAAMAGAWALLDERRLQGDAAMYEVEWDARVEAFKYAHDNKVASDHPTVSLNLDNASTGDVVFGRIGSDGNVDTGYAPSEYNAVRVLVERSADKNGEVSLFFGRILGKQSAAAQAEAIAVFRDGIVSFKSRASVPITSLLPFAMKIEDYLAMEAGAGNDDWHYDSDSGDVEAGGDGVAEGKLYPDKSNGSNIEPGNFGTVDIGPGGNSTADLSRQITDGVSSADLDAIGGELTVPVNLDGDTGLSSGVKDNLAAIIGQDRTIPLYDTVSGTGDTAQFHIVGFAGIRILDVQLTGNNKYVQIQPAIVTDGAAVGTDGNTPSYEVFEPVVLVK